MEKFSHPYFSIIVPMYNAEKYIGEALESILKQDFIEYEVIVVDDGSSDSSLDVLTLIVGKDPRFKIISQQNFGVSSARNRGLFQATGDYVIFLDSDDRLVHNALSKLHKITVENNFDIVICDYFQWFPNKGQTKRAAKLDLGITIGYLEFLGIILSTADYPSNFPCGGYACNKCFKRTFLNNAKFREFTSAAEDEFFCWDVAKHTMSVFYLPVQLFYYRQHAESLVHQSDFAFKHLITRKQMLLDAIKSSMDTQITVILSTAFTQTLISCFAVVLLNSSLFCSYDRLLWLKNQSLFLFNTI